MSVFVILTPGFPKDEQDTTCLPAVQQFVLSVKKKLQDHTLLIISFQYPFEKKEYDWNGIRVISIGGKNKPRLYRLITWLSAYSQLKKIKRETPLLGLLSLWVTECALVGNYFSKRHGFKHYSWIMGQDAKSSNNYVNRIRLKGQQLIAMSDFIRDEFYKNHGELPFLVAENGITESIFPPFNEGKRSIHILGAGSLIPLKNYRLFIEVLAEIKKTHPNIRAAIAGSGEQKDQLLSQARQLGVQDNLQFKGLVSHAQVLELMADSEIFLHPSDYEGNSTVLIEALYSGCQVVSKTGLSKKDVKNLAIKTNKEDILESLLALLGETRTHQRVLFNAMDQTAERILNLFLK